PAGDEYCSWVCLIHQRAPRVDGREAVALHTGKPPAHNGTGVEHHPKVVVLLLLPARQITFEVLLGAPTHLFLASDSVQQPQLADIETARPDTVRVGNPLASFRYVRKV